MKKAAILAAGEGMRIQSIARFKPIVKINGTPLLELVLKNLHFHNFQNISIIFNDNEREMDLSLLPGLKSPAIHYFFKSTPSSLHSLYEVCLQLNLKTEEHFFVSMVDSIIPSFEAQKFHQFCLTLKNNESAILATPFIDDETPLTLKINPKGYVTEFQCPMTDDVLITSGVYYFSAKIIPFLFDMINSGHTKMRNFLTELVKHNHKIKAYITPKTLDIDRPEDIENAEIFLRSALYVESKMDSF